MNKRFPAVLFVFVFSVSVVFADSEPSPKADPPSPMPGSSAAQGVPAELDRRIAEAKRVLDEVMMTPDKSIPEELLAKCKAIAIYPRTLKGAFIFGARFGRGVVLRKGDDGQWGPPAFSTLGGGNAGFQIGGQVTDYILVVMNERGLNGLLSNNFTLGADASFAAGPVGRKSAISTDLSLRSEILTYARSMGLFGGVSIDGAILTQDNNSNALYYGTPASSKDILIEGTVRPQPSSAPLIEALNRYSELWATTPHDNLPAEQTETPDFQGYVESIDLKDGSMMLIDSRAAKDLSQGKTANLKVKAALKDLTTLKLEDEVQVFFDKSGKQKEARKIIKLPSRRAS